MNLRFGITLFCLLAIFNFVAAQKYNPERSFEVTVDRTDPSEIIDGVHINLRTGTPKTIYGLRYKVDPATPILMAKNYLTAERERYGLTSMQISENLEVASMRAGLSGKVVRLQQMIEGIKVHNAEIAIHINHQHEVTFVTNDLTINEVPDIIVPRFTADNALNIVRNRMQVGAYDLFSNELVWLPIKDELRLTHRVHYHSQSPQGEWEGFVDALTGELIQLKDIAHYFNHDGHDHGDPTSKPIVNWHPPMRMMSQVDGSGFVFDPDPLSSGGVSYGANGYVDNNDAASPQLNGERVNVVLNDLTLTGGQYSLVGPWAEIREIEAPTKGLFSQNSSVFEFDRSDDAFDAVNTYYHIDASMRYLNLTLGLDIRPTNYSGGVRFDPHGVNGSDNSYYSGGGEFLVFGEGCVDDAEDSDVIHHELGHGLHDWVTGGNLSQTDGLSEGSGDYWAGSYNRFLADWQPEDPAYHFIFNWDGHNECWNGRTNNYRPATPAYPNGLGGGIHADGQIWSTCMMDVWDEIGRERCDVIFWEGLGMTGGSSSQNDAANAVYQAAIDLNYTGEELTAIYDRLTDCGYTIPCLHCTTDEDGDGFTLLDDCDDGDASINPDAMEIPNNDIDEDCDGVALIIDEDGDGFNSDEDCDDMDASINPDAMEIPNNDIDEDCDGELGIVDEDGDGFGNDVDCNDNDSSINPDAEEIPNNDVDEDCDGVAQMIDEDGDGFNSDEDCDDNEASVNPDAEEIPNNDVDEDCDGVAQMIDEDGDGFNSDEDCDDNEASVNPDAEEIPNNDVDEDCDGVAQMIDEDGDGFNSDEDCDDTEASINPDAEEIPNNDVDEDCDGVAQMIDEDGDGFNSDEDCDDTEASINPDAEEIPNNDVDEDCDGVAQIIDEDGDGFNSDEDCDDTEASINPDAEEIPNNDVDEDCDGVAQIIDEDGDGFNSDEDCDDMEASINPDAMEIPNNDVDEDCDGVAQIIDEDGDGFNSDEDCDDNDASINPDAEEIPNNDVDEDCDGIVLITNSASDEFAASLQVFPNPVDQELYIRGIEGGPVQIEMYDVFGKVVLRDIRVNANTQLDMSDMAAGVYMIRIRSERKSSLTKVEMIVKR